MTALSRVAAITCAAAVAATALAPIRAQQGTSTAPKLVVLLVVDQMRADYVDRFAGDWTGGLKRLMREGAWFRRAAYPYLLTWTCSGHATISTGTYPNVHGIVQNEWWDGERQKWIWCVEDGSASNIGYLRAAADGQSGRSLLVPTLADELRTRRGAHVVTLSLKDDAAIMLAGHGADAVTWVSSTLDNVVTSTMFAERPVPAVLAFVRMNPIEGYFRRAWDRSLPSAQYKDRDDGIGEIPPVGWTSRFPHPLNGIGGAPNAYFRVQWLRSPFVDEYIGRMASALIDSMQLGRHEGADVLAVSFSATDTVGHVFGPRSQEIQDTLARLDRTVGLLLDRLDGSVGRNQYVVALTSDHGVTPIPEQLVREGREGGRLDPLAIVERVEARLRAEWGRNRYVAALTGSNMNLYFRPGVYERLRGSPGVLNGVIQTIEQTRGISRAFRAEQVRDQTMSSDPMVRAVALSYFPGRSGDVIIVLKPGWNATGYPAMHGSATPDDQQVPLLLMGVGIKRGEYWQSVGPIDVAPTLAALAGITLPRAQGRVLREALD